MTTILNLALPWLLAALMGYLQPATLDPNFWLLQGLDTHLTMFGIPALIKSYGLVGIFVPLIAIHNVTYLVVRLIQARMDLDFLPMIRWALAWICAGVFGYWGWLSFMRGASFGEFHPMILMLIPPVAFILGLAFFVAKHKAKSAAQLTALFVAWAPIFSIVASLAGNHLRPPSLFAKVRVEPGAEVIGWDAIDPKTRSSGFLRLTIEKEQVPITFPSLAKNLKIEFTSNQKVIKIESSLDPINGEKLLAFPDTIENAGWRPTASNQKMLRSYCVSKELRPLSLEWVKADAVLAIEVKKCAEVASWSMSASTTFFALGRVDYARAQRIKEQRESKKTTLGEVDRSLLSNIDWRQRKLGISLISQVNDVNVIPLLSHAFYDKDVEVRQTAAVALLSWGAKVEPYLEKALADQNPYMRGDALRIVAASRKHAPHPASFQLLSDPSDYVQVSAVQALAPFVKDSQVLMTLMRSFDKEFSKTKKGPYVDELVRAIASAEDPRTASTLLEAVPKIILPFEAKYKGQALYEAIHSLRGMKNWLGVDYLQAIVKRSSNLENREKALAIMALNREPGDEASFIKALQAPELRAFAMTLVPAFQSEAVNAAVARLQEPQVQAR